MTNIYLLCGLPGSGKSTWVEEQAECCGDTAKVISRDKIRFSLLKEGEDYFKRENAVFAQFVKEINDSISSGAENIFIDATHINSKSRAKILNRIKFPEHCFLKVEIFMPTIATCIERNNKREGLARVPNGVIESMARDFETPYLPEFNYLKNKVTEIGLFLHDEDHY